MAFHYFSYFGGHAHEWTHFFLKHLDDESCTKHENMCDVEEKKIK